MVDTKSIAVSCRVRFARNIAGFPFPHILDNAKSQDLIKRISECMDKRSYNCINISSLPEVDRLYLMERHLISPDLMKNSANAAVVLKRDETVSVMINEEDHIRIQGMAQGFELEKAYKAAGKVDTSLMKKLSYAFDSQLGFITACPTNIGTGLRASVMLHLPALKMTNSLANVFSALNKIGLTVRGIYGEGTEALGEMYQLSNRTTLGQSEAELIQNVKRAAQRIIESEQLSRQQLMQEKPTEVEDRIYRSYATLKYARKLTSKEFMKLISDLKLGMSLGFFHDNGSNTADNLLLNVQPAGILKRLNKDVGAEERDIARAEIVRSTISTNITE